MIVLQLSSFIRSKASVRHLRPSFSMAFLTFWALNLVSDRGESGLLAEQ